MDRRPSLRSGARGKKQAVWHTAQPRKQRPIESHGRKSHGAQPIDPLRGGLTEGANEKVYMGTRMRTYTYCGSKATTHRLMVVQGFCALVLSKAANLLANNLDVGSQSTQLVTRCGYRHPGRLLPKGAFYQEGVRR